MASTDSTNQPATTDSRLPVPFGSLGERSLVPAALGGLEQADVEGGRVVPANIASPLSLNNLLKVFRHSWLLASTVGITLLLVFGAAAWYFLPAKYTAYALIRVTESEQPLLPDQRGGTAPTERYFENTQVAIIKSRNILKAALQQEGVSKLSIVSEQSDPIAWLEEHLKVGFLDKTDILRISLDGFDPKELATLVNAVTDAYMEEEVNAQRNKKKALLDDLDKVYTDRAERIRQERSHLSSLAKQLKSSDVQALSVKQKAILEQYASLRKELSLLQAQIRSAEIAIAMQKNKGDKPDPTVPDSVLEQAVEADIMVAQKKMELAQLEKESSRLASLTEPGHPSRDRYDRERKGLESALEEYRTRARTNLSKQVKERFRGDQQLKAQQAQDNLEIWREQEKFLSKEVQDVQKEAETMGLTTFELELKRSELEQGEAVLRRLRDEKNRLSIEMESNHKRISLLHDAEVPNKKNLAAQIRMTGFASAMGLLLGLFGVCYWEARAHRIMNKEEVANVLGCRVIGVLPWVAASSKRQNGSAVDPVARLTASVGDLRALLLCEAERRGAEQVLMVTSAVAREGKTTLASHLAVSVAQAGRRTLLIDGDFNRPQLHRVFDLARGPGLSEVLHGTATLSEVIQEGPVPGLSVLAAGEDSHMITSAQVIFAMRNLLDAARKEFDFILIDSPPILPVADALLLGRRADAVLLSVRPSVSQFPLVSAAFERLASLRIPVMGTVVNGVRSRIGDYDYGYVTESVS